jgi:hypothetical protein
LIKTGKLSSCRNFSTSDRHDSSIQQETISSLRYTRADLVENPTQQAFDYFKNFNDNADELSTKIDNLDDNADDSTTVDLNHSNFDPDVKFKPEEQQMDPNAKPKDNPNVKPDEAQKPYPSPIGAFLLKTSNSDNPAKTTDWRDELDHPLPPLNLHERRWA